MGKAKKLCMIKVRAEDHDELKRLAGLKQAEVGRRVPINEVLLDLMKRKAGQRPEDACER